MNIREALKKLVFLGFSSKHRRNIDRRMTSQQARYGSSQAKKRKPFEPHRTVRSLTGGERERCRMQIKERFFIFW